jgi:hypothetical protein
MLLMAGLRSYRPNRNSHKTKAALAGLTLPWTIKRAIFQIACRNSACPTEDELSFALMVIRLSIV